MKKWNGRALVDTSPNLVIESDASNRGWGVNCLHQHTGGPWSPQESQMHINYLELLATSLAVHTFAKNRAGISVLLKINNTTAVAYINNKGGTVSKNLLDLTKDLWMWCLEGNI